MLFKSQKGMYQIVDNYRDAFNLEMFESKYIEECMDKYLYIVGDISSGILRLKGFSVDPKSKAYYKGIKAYLETSCSFGCPHYILKRVSSEDEYKNLEALEANKVQEEEKPLITPIVKENFDKESLILKTTPKCKPNIVLNMNRINAMPKGELASDLVEVLRADKIATNYKGINNKLMQEEKKEETTYVSASPDFDPSKSSQFRFNKNNKNNGNNQNNNNKQNNKNKQNKPNNQNNQNNKGNNNQNNNQNGNKPNNNKQNNNNNKQNKNNNNQANKHQNYKPNNNDANRKNNNNKPKNIKQANNGNNVNSSKKDN